MTHATLGATPIAPPRIAAVGRVDRIGRLAAAVATALFAGCSCGSPLPPSDLADASPEDSVFVDAMPRDATLPCGRGVALRWLDATPGEETVRVNALSSAPLGAGALLLRIEQHDLVPDPVFALGLLADLDGSTLAAIPLAPLTRAQWLLPIGTSVLAIDLRDMPDASLSVGWAAFDGAGGGPLQEATWPLPSGVSFAHFGNVCDGGAALPILLSLTPPDHRAGMPLAVGAALVSWPSPTDATISDFVFPADGSLGLSSGSPGVVSPEIQGCLASDAITHVLVRPGASGPLRVLRWSEGRLLELPKQLGTAAALSGVALLGAEGPLFFSFDATSPSVVRAFRAAIGGELVELDARPLDGFPYRPVPFGATMLDDGTAMLLFQSGAETGLFAAIAFAGGRFGAPVLISDVSCVTQSPVFRRGRRVLWPAACGVGGAPTRLAMFELCRGEP